MDIVVGEVAEQTLVPIRARGWDIENGTLLFTYNATAPSESGLRRIRERGGISTGYAQALLFYDQGRIEGNATTRLRGLEINNTAEQPETFVVNNSLARKFGSRQIDSIEFSMRVADTIRNQTAQEREWTRNIDRTAGNVTLGPNGTINVTDEE